MSRTSETKKLSRRKSRQPSQLKNLSPRAADRLLTTAKHLFARQGLSGTSIRDIAKAAGLNSSLISYYYSGKEGLYRACLQQIGESLLAMTESVLQPPRDPSEFRVRLMLLIENLFRLYLDDLDAGLIIVREFDRVHSPAEQVFRNTFFRIFDSMAQFFTQAQKRGLLSKKLDPFILTSLLFGAVTNEMRFDHLREKVYQRSLKDPKERQKVEEHLLQLFFQPSI